MTVKPYWLFDARYRCRKKHKSLEPRRAQRKRKALLCALRGSLLFRVFCDTRYSRAEREGDAVINRETDLRPSGNHLIAALMPVFKK